MCSSLYSIAYLMFLIYISKGIYIAVCRFVPEWKIREGSKEKVTGACHGQSLAQTT